MAIQPFRQRGMPEVFKTHLLAGLLARTGVGVEATIAGGSVACQPPHLVFPRQVAGQLHPDQSAGSRNQDLFSADHPVPPVIEKSTVFQEIVKASPVLRKLLRKPQGIDIEFGWVVGVFAVARAAWPVDM